MKNDELKDNISKNNLIELQNYLHEKYNINVYYNNSKKNNNQIGNINQIYIRLFILLFFLYIIIFYINAVNLRYFIKQCIL